MIRKRLLIGVKSFIIAFLLLLIGAGFVADEINSLFIFYFDLESDTLVRSLNSCHDNLPVSILLNVDIALMLIVVILFGWRRVIMMRNLLFIGVIPLIVVAGLLLGFLILRADEIIFINYWSDFQPIQRQICLDNFFGSIFFNVYIGLTLVVATLLDWLEDSF